MSTVLDNGVSTFWEVLKGFDEAAVCESPERFHEKYGYGEVVVKTTAHWPCCDVTKELMRCDGCWKRLQSSVPVICAGCNTPQVYPDILVNVVFV